MQQEIVSLVLEHGITEGGRQQTSAQGGGIDAYQIYERITSGPGTASLNQGHTASSAMSERYDDRVKQIQDLDAKMSAAWTGDGAESARMGAQPLRQWMTETGSDLGKSSSVLSTQADAHNKVRTEVEPIPEHPPSSHIFNDLAPWDTDLDKKIADYNDKANKNVQVFNDYHSASTGNASALPHYATRHGAIGDVALAGTNVSGDKTAGDAPQVGPGNDNGAGTGYRSSGVSGDGAHQTQASQHSGPGGPGTPITTGHGNDTTTTTRIDPRLDDGSPIYNRRTEDGGGGSHDRDGGGGDGGDGGGGGTMLVPPADDTRRTDLPRYDTPRYDTPPRYEPPRWDPPFIEPPRDRDIEPRPPWDGSTPPRPLDPSDTTGRDPYDDSTTSSTVTPTSTTGTTGFGPTGTGFGPTGAGAGSAAGGFGPGGGVGGVVGGPMGAAGGLGAGGASGAGAPVVRAAASRVAPRRVVPARPARARCAAARA
ncbi:hypothetical protein BJF85_06145 [Saccharomonospora sp. CUA-673]|uniref:PPE domain-containing protein n=1 Tax=Saccharomonospora sp. CUA-673 TaxID=1904969 RepID=UPI00096062DC|nr:PPE domain-containing protein [Saccharomonospora sp. CUA-673]OLT40697.1 hypothetical protein BJF85_06145 [Saccharomonospora sp. CUA-673]